MVLRAKASSPVNISHCEWMRAIQIGDEDRVAQGLSQGFSMIGAGKEGTYEDNPLKCAIFYRKPSALRKLLAPLTPEECEATGDLLGFAVRSGGGCREEIISALAATGFVFSTPLIASIYRHDLNECRSHLEQCDSEEARREALKFRDEGGMAAFHYAAILGRLEILELLKAQGAEVGARDGFGFSALHLAALHSGSVETVQWLLRPKAEGGAGLEGPLEARGQYQRTPFLCAAVEGQLAVLKELKAQGAEVSARDEFGDSALHLAAAFSGHVETVQWLLRPEAEGGAGLRLRTLLEARGQYQCTPFLCAAMEGQLAVLKELKAQGANVRARDEFANSALHLAALESGSVETVQWLVRPEAEGGVGLKALLEVRGQCQRTPFLCAAAKGQLAVLKELKAQGAEVSARDEFGDSALHLAALESGSVETVQWLLRSEEKGGAGLEASLETKGHYQSTPFLHAAEKGQLVVLAVLKAAGADVCARDEFGNSALHRAALSGHVPTLWWLLQPKEKGGAGLRALLEVRGQYQRTPFLAAAEKGHLAVLAALKAAGADMRARDEFANSALHLAALESGSVETVQWLLRSEAEGEVSLEALLEAKGQYQRTPFLCAAEKGQLAVLQELKAAGANVCVRDEFGDSALHLAALSGSVEAAQWLLRSEEKGGAGLEALLEARGQCQCTPFLGAAEKGHLAVLAALKAAGANVDARDGFGYSALHLAALHSGSVETVQWLLRPKAEGGAGLKALLEAKGRYQRTPFLCAAEKGQLAVLQELKAADADMRARDEFGNSALHLAALSGHVPTVHWLLRPKAEGGAGLKALLEAKGRYQRTPFLCAAEKGQLAVLQELKAAGADMRARDEFGNSALHLTPLSGHVPTVHWLLRPKAEGGAGLKALLEAKGRYQRTPFLCAAEKGQLAVLQELKAAGADMRARDEFGNSALHLAALSGHVPTVHWLLRPKAEGGAGLRVLREVRGQYQRTPFLCAAEKGQLAVLKELKAQGAEVSARDEFGDSALHLAALESGSVETVQWLLRSEEKGGAGLEASLETKGHYQSTPFLHAAVRGQLAVLQELKAAGADVCARDEFGNSALHRAALESGSVETVQWLVRSEEKGGAGLKALLEIRGQYQCTPFLHAAGRGQLAVLQELKAAGADVCARDEFGNSALHLAALHSGSVETVQWLLRPKAEGGAGLKALLEAKGQYQRTPFLCAAERGQLAVLQELKAAGADMRARDEFGNSALHLAALSGSVETVQWLLRPEAEGGAGVELEARGVLLTKPVPSYSLFVRAVLTGCVDNAEKYYCEIQISINTRIHPSGNAALHHAIVSENVELFRWVLPKKPDWLLKNYSSMTPFEMFFDPSKTGFLKSLTTDDIFLVIPSMPDEILRRFLRSLSIPVDALISHVTEKYFGSDPNEQWWKILQEHILATVNNRQLERGVVFGNFDTQQTDIHKQLMNISESNVIDEARYRIEESRGEMVHDAELLSQINSLLKRCKEPSTTINWEAKKPLFSARWHDVFITSAKDPRLLALNKLVSDLEQFIVDHSDSSDCAAVVKDFKMIQGCYIAYRDQIVKLSQDSTLPEDKRRARLKQHYRPRWQLTTDKIKGRYLSEEVSSLLTEGENEDFVRVGECRGHGNHAMRRCRVDSLQVDIHLKFHVEGIESYPGMEFVVASLYSQLAGGEGYAMAPTTLAKFHRTTDRGEEESQMVVVSKTVEGLRLDYFLRRILAACPGYLDKFDTRYFPPMVSTAFLTNPHDAKAHNYIVQIVGSSGGGGEEDFVFRPVGVDNACVLAELVARDARNGGEHHTEVRCVFYFFPHMDHSVAQSFREHLIQCLPEIAIINWLSELNLQNAHYLDRLKEGRFSQAELDVFQLPIKFVPGTVSIIYHRLLDLWLFLKSRPAATHQELFAHLYPDLAAYYSKLRTEVPDNELSGLAILKSYEKLARGGGPSLEKKGITRSRVPDANSPWKGLPKERPKMETCLNRQASLEMEIEAWIATLDFSTSHLKGKGKEVLGKLQTVLCPAVLVIRNCEELDDAGLRTLVIAQKGLRQLSLVGCPNVSTAGVNGAITAYERRCGRQLKVSLMDCARVDLNLYEGLARKNLLQLCFFAPNESEGDIHYSEYRNGDGESATRFLQEFFSKLRIICAQQLAFLIHRGVDLNAYIGAPMDTTLSDFNGYTLLHVLVSLRNRLMVERLLEVGKPDLEMKSKVGKKETAYELALAGKAFAMCRVLDPNRYAREPEVQAAATAIQRVWRKRKLQVRGVAGDQRLTLR